MDREDTPIVPKVSSPLDGPTRRPPSAKSVEKSKKMMFAVAAVSALLVIPMVAVVYFSEGQGVDRPVEDLSFQGMGKDVDRFVADVEHETDFRNILGGRTYAEKDIQGLIHGTHSKSSGAAADEKGRKTATKISGESSAPGKASRGVLTAQPAVEEKETPLASHWVQAPVVKKVKTPQEQLRALVRKEGGPEIVYQASLSKQRHARSAHPSPAVLRARRAHAMRTDEGASRELGNYFAHAHSAVAEHVRAVPFAHDRLWTVGTEKADMNNYFDSLQTKTLRHVKEINNLHKAVEPSTAWQDGFERSQDRPTRVLSTNSGQQHVVMTQAANILKLANSDLKSWKHAHPEVAKSTPATEAP